ncbi:phage tail protein [Alkalibaculum sp. M08DMB]|uniref:Phage tail protein n=1 Tax=Alkalibaculum sporogenes TaxID=2655001 RepID=A0A6A7KAU3_9FIRM|nr:major tail protein [Alkalibaculum sporogenes]MPW26401.1 phage tail protein [Alkalibaculum sporogenes]
MPISTKKPARKQTVGALYYDFATDMDAMTYAGTPAKSEVVKSVSTTENEESEPVYASGKIYDTPTLRSSDEIEVEVVAIDPDDLAKMRGENIDASGLVLSGGAQTKPFFAFGKVVVKTGSHAKYQWFPKCQLITKSDEASTSEGSPSEQNDTLTIQALPFDSSGNTNVYVDTEMTTFPPGLTEDLFFGQVIHSPSTMPVIPPEV